MPLDEVLYGAAEIGRALGLSRRVVYHRAAAGQIPVFRMGATLCAKRSSLDAWLAACDAGQLTERRAVEPRGGV